MKIMKRTLDIVLGTVLAIAAIPFIAMGTVLSVACLGSWPFFVQRRVGRKGKSFHIVKVRTLPRDVPAYAAKTTLDSTRLCRPMELLRRSHFDELPQLFLVPFGKMSLVGPRPEMPFLHESFKANTAALRTSVRPGCTGLWQISESSEALINEAPEYDRYYLLQQSVRFDLWILWRTVRLMITRAQPVRIDDIPQWVLPTETPEPTVDLTTARTRPSTVHEPV